MHMPSAPLLPPLLGINTGLITQQMDNYEIYQGFSQYEQCFYTAYFSEVYSCKLSQTSTSSVDSFFEYNGSDLVLVMID